MSRYKQYSEARRHYGEAPLAPTSTQTSIQCGDARGSAVPHPPALHDPAERLVVVAGRGGAGLCAQHSAEQLVRQNCRASVHTGHTGHVRWDERARLCSCQRTVAGHEASHRLQVHPVRPKLRSFRIVFSPRRRESLANRFGNPGISAPPPVPA